jgi:hypothetical protein
MDCFSEIKVQKRLLRIPSKNGSGTIFVKKTYYQQFVINIKYFTLYITYSLTASVQNFFMCRLANIRNKTVPETENRTDVKPSNSTQTGRDRFSGASRKASALP